MHDPSLPVADCRIVRGAAASLDAEADLLVEVPHGADRAAHYEAVKAELHGPLPDQLEHFFFVNTDVGAWQLGLWVAEEVVRRQPHRTVELIRCLVPRTFIDTNRQPGERGGHLGKGGMTPGLQPYVHHPDDQRWLRGLHERYTAVVAEAMERVVGAGGHALIPHTYGKVTMGIERVDDDIVRSLHWAMDPVRADTWPVRPEVDIIHTTADGTSLAPAGMVDALAAAYRADGHQVELGGTYYLHPATTGFAWCDRYPGRILTLEVRRDLLVEHYTPFAEMQVRDDAIERFGTPLAQVLCSS